MSDMMVLANVESYDYRDDGSIKGFGYETYFVGNISYSRVMELGSKAISDMVLDWSRRNVPSGDRYVDFDLHDKHEKPINVVTTTCDMSYEEYVAGWAYKTKEELVF